MIGELLLSFFLGALLLFVSCEMVYIAALMISDFIDMLRKKRRSPDALIPVFRDGSPVLC